MDLAEWDTLTDVEAVLELETRIKARNVYSHSQRMQYQLELLHLCSRRSLLPEILASYNTIFHRFNLFSDRSTLWFLYEIGSIAAMELGEAGARNDYLSALEKEMPMSVRVRRLRGMVLENAGMFEDAQKLYDEILQKDPLQMQVRKRVTSLFLQRDDISGAIKSLNEHVLVCSEDTSVWEALYTIYLSQGMLPQARFACEELITLAPHSHVYSTMYADILYTMASSNIYGVQQSKTTPTDAGFSNKIKNSTTKGDKTVHEASIEHEETPEDLLLLAFKFYVNSLDLKDKDNVRASFGMQKTIKKLQKMRSNKNSTNDNETITWITLLKFSQDCLLQSVPQSSIFLKLALSEWFVEGNTTWNPSKANTRNSIIRLSTVIAEVVKSFTKKNYGDVADLQAEVNKAARLRLNDEIITDTSN